MDSKAKSTTDPPWFANRLAPVGLVAVLVFFGACWGGGGTAGSLQEWEGVLAPDVAFTTLDGREMRLSEMRGRRVVLNFWATWCGPCRREIPDLIAVARRSGEELVILGISDEPPETLQPFVEQQGINYAVVSADSSGWPSPYRDFRYIPTNFILDRQGVIQYVRGPVSARTLDKLLRSPDHRGTPKAAPTR